MKKVFVGLFLITSCISAEGQVAFCYNNKDYLVNENNIVLDSLDNSYTYEEWQKLYNTGNYGLVPVVPGYEKTLFRLVRMSEEDKKKYYSDIKKPLETNFFKTGTTFDFFRGRDMDGNIINAKKLGGKIVVINFWFINCAPCRKEIPLLNKLVSDYKKDSDIVFVAIALDSKKDLKTFFETTAFDYPVIYNGDYLARRYNVRVFPTNLIVDKNGKVAYHSSMSGPIPDYWMRKTIEEIKKRQT